MSAFKRTVHAATDSRQQRQRVLRIFQEEDWGNLELVDEWDGEDVDELKTILSDEEFQTLLDRLSGPEGDER